MLSLRRQRRELSVCAMAVLRHRRGLWGSEPTSCCGPSKARSETQCCPRRPYNPDSYKISVGQVAPLSGRGPSKAWELGACLLRHQAFQKPPPSQRLLKGLVHQRTGTQLHREKRKRSSSRHNSIDHSSKEDKHGQDAYSGEGGLRSHWIEWSEALSSPYLGVCSSTDTSVLRKGGIIWQKCHFACCVPGSHLTRYCEFYLLNFQKNNRQLYTVSELTGQEISAESWGADRAVAQIPKVRGGGTHRSGQGSTENTYCGSYMFVSTKTWYHWYQSKREHNAVAIYCLLCPSVLAAMALPALLMSKGHHIEEVPKFPLVVKDKVEGYQKKPQETVLLLKKIKAWNDIKKVYASHRMRAGRGKKRNSSYLEQGTLHHL
ncbi:hypothetical protein QTO34_013714 [Cnephaeus nilssonii]|uniref:Uncharacterized protein n=1 Tax=Cnephaeus nilssonii TaxID=3371016 RepID=A0AA40I8J4_CNENI|nr:hypothetical protein QTO34_013714 [Eptesicus nilssonii]